MEVASTPWAFGWDGHLATERHTKMRRVIFRMICHSAAVILLLSTPCAAQRYPLFVHYELLYEVGISQNNFANDQQHKKLQNSKYLPCYYYGDGGLELSISPAFLERFISRGFTRQSLCLGLVSETRYNPETGERLPTYIVVNSQANKDLKDHDLHMNNDITHELPLDLPDCFRNGNPYSDCQFKFGRLTGKKLTVEETDIYHRLGAAYDMLAATFLSKTKTKDGQDFFDVDNGKIIETYDGMGGSLARAWDCLFECETPEESGISELLLRYSSATFWARSSNFPRGYGYALDAEGGAGEDADPASVRAALQAVEKQNVSAEELGRVLAGKH